MFCWCAWQGDGDSGAFLDAMPGLDDTDPLALDRCRSSVGGGSDVASAGLHRVGERLCWLPSSVLPRQFFFSSRFLCGSFFFLSSLRSPVSYVVGHTLLVAAVQDW